VHYTNDLPKLLEQLSVRVIYKFGISDKLRIQFFRNIITFPENLKKKKSEKTTLFKKNGSHSSSFGILKIEDFTRLAPFKTREAQHEEKSRCFCLMLDRL